MNCKEHEAFTQGFYEIWGSIENISFANHFVIHMHTRMRDKVINTKIPVGIDVHI